MTVEQQHAVTLILSGLDVRILLLLIGGVEINELVVLILLICLDERLVFIECEVLALRILKQSEVLGAIVETILREDTVVDEEFQVVPRLP